MAPQARLPCGRNEKRGLSPLVRNLALRGEHDSSQHRSNTQYASTQISDLSVVLYSHSRLARILCVLNKPARGIGVGRFRQRRTLCKTRDRGRELRVMSALRIKLISEPCRRMRCLAAFFSPHSGQATWRAAALACCHPTSLSRRLHRLFGQACSRREGGRQVWHGEGTRRSA